MKVASNRAVHAAGKGKKRTKDSPIGIIAPVRSRTSLAAGCLH